MEKGYEVYNRTMYRGLSKSLILWRREYVKQKDQKSLCRTGDPLESKVPDDLVNISSHHLLILQNSRTKVIKKINKSFFSP